MTINKKPLIFLIVAAAILTAFFLSPVNHAQEYGTSDSQEDLQKLPPHLNVAKVKAFARASKSVNELHRKYELRLVDATPQEAIEIREEAARKISKAVERHGLSVDEYNNIARTMVTNPPLKQQIERELESI